MGVRVIIVVCLLAICCMIADAQQGYVGRPRGPSRPGPWPPLGPPDRPDCSIVTRIFCIANWCTVNQCPRYPSAVCRNLCNSPCLGAYFLGGRQIPESSCQSLY